MTRYPDEEPASSADETENDTYCEIVFEGLDTDGSVWNRCTVHNRLVFGDAPVCEGYRAPAYVERPDVDEVYTPGSGEDDYDEAVQQERERD